MYYVLLFSVCYVLCTVYCVVCIVYSLIVYSILFAMFCVLCTVCYVLCMGQGWPNMFHNDRSPAVWEKVETQLWGNMSHDHDMSGCERMEALRFFR